MEKIVTLFIIVVVIKKNNSINFNCVHSLFYLLSNKLDNDFDRTTQNN